MTLSNQVRSVTHQGDGTTTVFPYEFLIPSVDEVRVSIYNTITGLETPLSFAQFQITGIANFNGGTVTYYNSLGPLPSTQFITIARKVPYTQEVDIMNQDGFHPSVVERGMDRIVMQVQQLADKLRYMPRFPRTGNNLDVEIDPLVANKYLQVNGTATKVIMGDRGDQALMVPGTETVGDAQVIMQSIGQLRLNPEGIGYVFETAEQAMEAGELMTTYPQMITLQGWAFPGDYGGGRFVAVGGEPPLHPKIQLGDQWYRWAELWITPQACGYFSAANILEKSQALQNAIDAGCVQALPILWTQLYELDPTVTLRYDANCMIYGNGDTTGLTLTGAVAALAPYNPNTNIKGGVIFKNFNINGTQPFVPGSGGIILQNTLDAYVENVATGGVDTGFVVTGNPSFPAQGTTLINCSAGAGDVGFFIGSDQYAPEDFIDVNTQLYGPKTINTTYGIIIAGSTNCMVLNSRTQYLTGGIIVSDNAHATTIVSPYFARELSGAHEFDLAVSATPSQTEVWSPTWSGPGTVQGNLVDEGASTDINGRRYYPVIMPPAAQIPPGAFIRVSFPQAPGFTATGPGWITGEVSMPQDASTTQIYGFIGGNDGTYVHLYIFNRSGVEVDLAGQSVNVWLREFLG